MYLSSERVTTSQDPSLFWLKVSLCSCQFLHVLVQSILIFCFVIRTTIHVSFFCLVTLISLHLAGLKCLHLAAQRPFPALLKQLIEHGGSPGVRDRAGQTLLHYSARSGSWEVAEYLLTDPVVVEALSSSYRTVRYIEQKDRWSRTALHWAVLNGHLPVVKLLLEHGASCTSKVRDYRHHRSTRLTQESPTEISLRLWGTDHEITRLLLSKTEE
jgi:ankyrin repeat protein